MSSKTDQTEKFSLVVLKRYSVLKSLVDGHCNTRQAAQQLKLSMRQVVRLKNALIFEGIEGLTHKNTKRIPTNRLSGQKRQLVFSVFQDWKAKTDLGVNCAHLSDILLRDYRLKVSRQTLWRLLRTSGRLMPSRKVKKHRVRRQRSEAEGQILHLDGSEHRWFGREHPLVTLILCCDDASTRALYGVFVPFENLAGCFEVAFNIFSQLGLPSAFYLDRASQFKTTRKI